MILKLELDSEKLRGMWVVDQMSDTYKIDSVDAFTLFLTWLSIYLSVSYDELVNSRQYSYSDFKKDVVRFPVMSRILTDFRRISQG